ncbi:MAG: AAA family ATPase [Endomicrobium sp.]|nr:AAA family ATPase [Endomicrobium sp.]
MKKTLCFPNMKKLVSLLLVGMLLFSSVKPAGALTWDELNRRTNNVPNEFLVKFIIGTLISGLLHKYWFALTSLSKTIKRRRSPISSEDILKHFDERVTGQAKTKRTLAIAGYNHYKRVLDGVKFQRANLLILGPTGCGKTFLAQTMANLLNLPFVIADSKDIDSANNNRNPIDTIFSRLLDASHYDVKLAEKGIVFLDEIDKIKDTRLTSSVEAQKRLLKILEGTKFTTEHVYYDVINGRNQRESLTIDTSNILFVCSGAFVGLEDIIKQRTDNVNATLSEVNDKDLIEFGFIPEFVGRIPIVSVMDPLNTSDLLSILSESKNCLVKQYKARCASENVELEFEKEALEKIAEKAVKKQLGARGLVSVLEDLMEDVFYKITTNRLVRKCIITAESVEKGESPMFEYASPPPPSKSFWQRLFRT